MIFFLLNIKIVSQVQISMTSLTIYDKDNLNSEYDKFNLIEK